MARESSSGMYRLSNLSISSTIVQLDLTLKDRYYASWFVYDYKLALLIVHKDLYRDGGNGRLVFMNCMSRISGFGDWNSSSARRYLETH